MSERRLVPRTDMLFYPWARFAKGADAGQVVDINHLGLSLISKDELHIDDSFSIFLEDEHHEELCDKSLELLVQVIRCKKLQSGYFEIGLKIMENKTKSGDVLLNKFIRLLGSP